ncbi:MAG: hypothetical protein L0Y71_02820 [Gemmataceae bacterium]|nr:hypothetical protein [Gemmataceae bacterium]
MLPEQAFGLFGICSRRPRDLFAAVPPETVQAGVYLCRRGTDVIRIVVAAELPTAEHNALLHLFSAADDRVQYGAKHYELPTADVSTLVNKLFAAYRREGLTMPYTMDDFRKEVAREVLHKLTPEERLRGLSAQEIENYLRRLRRKPKDANANRRKPKR